jgi:hypothetical protein
VNYQYNPYAAPQAAPPVAPGVLAAGAPQPWSVGEVIAIAWDRFKSNWPVVVFTYFLTMLVTQMVGQTPTVLTAIGAVAPGSSTATILTIVFTVLNVIVASYFQAGLTKIWVETARGGTPSFGTLFSGTRFLPYLGCYALYLLCVFFGSLAFIVPGIILGIGMVLGTWYVVDAKMGPIEALGASWNATKGHKGDLFVLALAAFGLALLGLLMLCVGIFVTVPISYIALGVAYTRISGIGPAPGVGQEGAPGGSAGALPPGYPSPGYGGPQGGPPGYGPPGAPPGYGPPPGYGGPPGAPPGYGPPR